MEKTKEFYLLKKRATGIAFNLPIGTQFTYHDLNLASNVICSTDVQQDVGRWFAYFVKYAPRVPFVIIGKDSSGNLIYRKVGPNPYHNSNYHKGGSF
ncbi:cassette chromosome ssDNA-binding protein [Mammaliicoccus sciuri]|uniref:cassette chromosome ssDNA-binding protein n=1 Tax=Mammaliicoccus sciuri TaxID=1296 RepID=UPI0034DD6491